MIRAGEQHQSYAKARSQLVDIVLLAIGVTAPFLTSPSNIWIKNGWVCIITIGLMEFAVGVSDRIFIKKSKQNIKQMGGIKSSGDCVCMFFFSRCRTPKFW